jgi:pimeloyl-ACP methyl ester carboxylesterase
MPSEIVILVHGLWMSGLELGVLRHRLEREHGFSTIQYSYASVTESMADHVRGLHELAEQQTCDRLHFVGHSMGGLVIYNLLESANVLIPGRAVLLGSPVQGSCVAAGIARWPLGRIALGCARESIAPEGPRHWEGSREIGVIAGSVSIGLGRLFADITPPSDGTVLVEETHLDGAADRIVMPVTHTSMVFSASVADQVAAFLHTGKFTK